MPFMEYERGFERLVNFSDAVVAIAATLLILPLVDIADPTEGASTWDVLSEHRVELFGFVLSFAVIFRLWLTHHRIFRDLCGYTTRLAWANFLWLLSIVFLPFPTKLIAEKNGYDASASSLYVGTIAVSVIAMAFIEWVVLRHPNIVVPDAYGAVDRYAGGVSAVLIVIAFGLAFTPVGLWSLFVMVLTSPIARVIRARRSRASG